MSDVTMDPRDAFAPGLFAGRTALFGADFIARVRMRVVESDRRESTELRTAVP